MKPLTNEQRDAVKAAIGDYCRLSDKGIDDIFNAAGLLEPEETAMEKARRLWKECNFEGPKSIAMHDAYERKKGGGK